MSDNLGQILLWDLSLAHLVIVQLAVTLTPIREIHFYTRFLGSGICQFFGYQLPDVVIVFNGEQTLELGTVCYALLTHPTSILRYSP